MGHAKVRQRQPVVLAQIRAVLDLISNADVALHAEAGYYSAVHDEVGDYRRSGVRSDTHPTHENTHAAGYAPRDGAHRVILCFREGQ